MIAEIQALTDQLSRSIAHSVVVHDAGFRLLAHAIFEDRIDPVSQHSILYREPPRAVREYVVSQGATTSISPVRLAGRDDLQLTARFMVPLRDQDRTLGILSVLEDVPLPEAGERRALEAAGHVTAILARERERRVERTERERALVRTLLEGGDTAAGAAASLADEGLFDAAPGFVVIAVVPAPGASADDARSALAEALRAYERLRRSLEGQAVAYDGDARALRIVCAPAHLERTGHDARSVAAAVATAGLIAGIGAPVATPADATTGLREALWSARAAPATDPGARVADWADLGPYQLIEAVDTDRARLAGLEALLQHRDGAVLLSTLETYLDLGGSAKLTADALFLHRGSLYQRLRRIETITAVRLADGRDRLALHLALKVARVEGRLEHPPPAPVGDDDALA